MARSLLDPATSVDPTTPAAPADPTTLVDPVTVEVVSHYLRAVADEMKRTIVRTAMSPVIYEVLDFSTGVFDRRGRLVAQTAGLAIFLGTLDWAVQATIRKFGADLHPGDVILTNDPYSGGGTHLNDVSVVAPVFYRGKLEGFVASRAHWMDIGGQVPLSVMTTATEINQEGLLLPVVRAYHRGRPDRQLLDFLAANVRLPEVMKGDFNAQLAASRAGERRLLELFERYGAETVDRCIEVFLDAGERVTRARLSAMPDGRYSGTEYLDTDRTTGRPVKVHVTIEKTGSELTLDFTGSDQATKSSYNVTYCGLVSGCRVLLRAITDPKAPTNDGCFRPLKVVAPPGTVVNAGRPSPVGMYGEVARRAIDAAWMALAEVLPGGLPAGHFGSICGQCMAGWDDREPEPRYTSFSGPNGGGWGATPAEDGESAMVCVSNGETKNNPVEILEAKNPLLITRYELRQDSGGPGKRRGGLGTTLEFRVLTSGEYMATFAAGRAERGAFGSAGGRPGIPNRVTVTREGQVIAGLERETAFALKKGDLITVESGGGGGWGDPAEREPSLVAADVEAGYVSPEAAEKEYGFRKS